MEHQERPYQPIENYGIIGNLRTTALVSLSGSIDFMSFPRFDSPTIFVSMLDSKKGGYFSVEPQLKDYTSKQLYIPGTAVLLTRYFSDDGIAELTDQITFTSINDGNAQLRLIADIPLQIRQKDGYAEFTLKQSETANIILEAVEQEDIDATTDIDYYINNSYQETITAWRKWLSKSTYKGHYSELIHRSAITLKLLTSIEHGSVVAAPTFGIPETLGGDRNWDYRFTWIRDAAFTMYAFITLGFYDEATAFMNWISGLCADNKLQLLYCVDGTKCKEETELGHLDGYKGSKPVRVGNGAASQLQIDIYGELIDTIYIYNKKHKPITYQFWTLIEKQVQCVVSEWKNPDHGIWEIRNMKKEFLHSRLMCWVAVDRAIKIAEHRSFPYPMERWHEVRNEIYIDIYENFWNEEKQSFVQAKGTNRLDASVLIMPMVRFITPTDKRWLKTLEAIERELKLDVLIYRYLNQGGDDDGLEGEEGTFTICSFWYAECLAKSGQAEKANEVFAKLLGYGNPLRLFSEQLSKRGEQLGNFPQGFTHLGLISAAIAINKLNNKAENKG
jgi:GH15 family glucan-1,4-alpha-glucosidase